MAVILATPTPELRAFFHGVAVLYVVRGQTRLRAWPRPYRPRVR